MILLLVTSKALLNVPHRYIAVIVMGFALAWIILSEYAKKEYTATIRKRLELLLLVGGDIEIAGGRRRFTSPRNRQLVGARRQGDPHRARQLCYP